LQAGAQMPNGGETMKVKTNVKAGGGDSLIEIDVDVDVDIGGGHKKC
jgi:hypothetical protein